MATPLQGHAGPTWDSIEASVVERQQAASATRALPGREAIMFFEQVAIETPGQSIIESVFAVRLHGLPHQAIRTETRADGSRRVRDAFLTADSMWWHLSLMKGAKEAHMESQPSRGSWRTVDQGAVFLHLPCVTLRRALERNARKLRSYLLLRLHHLPMSEAVEVSRLRQIEVALIEHGIKAASRANTLLTLRGAIKLTLEAKIFEKPRVSTDLLKRAEHVLTAPNLIDVATCIKATSCDEHRLVILLAAHRGARPRPLLQPRVAHASTSRPSSRPIPIHSAPVDVRALHVACGPRGAS